MRASPPPDTSARIRRTKRIRLTSDCRHLALAKAAASSGHSWSGAAGNIEDGVRLPTAIVALLVETGELEQGLLDHQLEVPASFDDVAKAGSMLGSAGIIVMDETTCMVWAAMNLMHFYAHESCGKCTPCREGGDWLLKILAKIERGDGEMRDLDLLTSVSNNIAGKTLCAFGDAEATPPLTTLKHFRGEYEAHIREGRCTVPASWRAARAVAVH